MENVPAGSKKAKKVEWLSSNYQSLKCGFLSFKIWPWSQEHLSFCGSLFCVVELCALKAVDAKLRSGKKHVTKTLHLDRNLDNVTCCLQSLLLFVCLCSGELWTCSKQLEQKCADIGSSRPRQSCCLRSVVEWHHGVWHVWKVSRHITWSLPDGHLLYCAQRLAGKFLSCGSFVRVDFGRNEMNHQAPQSGFFRKNLVLVCSSAMLLSMFCLTTFSSCRINFDLKSSESPYQTLNIGFGLQVPFKIWKKINKMHDIVGSNRNPGPMVKHQASVITTITLKWPASRCWCVFFLCLGFLTLTDKELYSGAKDCAILSWSPKEPPPVALVERENEKEIAKVNLLLVLKAPQTIHGISLHFCLSFLLCLAKFF